MESSGDTCVLTTGLGQRLMLCVINWDIEVGISLTLPVNV